MSALFVVLPLALLVAAVAVAAYVWAARSGQLDDLDTPAHRILHDDEPPPRPGSGSRNGAVEEEREKREPER